MTRQQVQQLVNWMMEDGDEIKSLSFQASDNSPIITIQRANGRPKTLHWRKWGETDDNAGWCLFLD